MATSRQIGRTAASSGTVEATSVGAGPSLSDDALNNTVIAAGPRMLFQQTRAPTGWTKDTGLNDLT